MSSESAAGYEPTTRPKTGGLSLRVVFNAVRRHPIVLMLVVALAGGAAASVWFFLPLPRKTVAAVFHVAATPHSILAPTSESRVDLASYKQSQVALIKSRKTLNAALNKDEVRGLSLLRGAEPDALTWLDNRLTVDSKAGVEYLRVSLEGDDGEELLTLLSAVVAAYRQASKDRDEGNRGLRKDELEKKYTESKKVVAGFRLRVEEIGRTLGGTTGMYLVASDKFREADFLKAITTHASLEEELAAAKGGLEAARRAANRKAVLAVAGGAWLGSLSAVELHAGSFVPVTMLDEKLRNDPALRELEAAVTKARLDLAEVQDKLGSGTAAEATLDKFRAALKAAEEKRDIYRAAARAEADGQLREASAQTEDARLVSAQIEYDRLKPKVDAAWTRVKDARAAISKASEYKIELDNLTADIAQKEKMTTAMADELDRLTVELAAPARVSVVEEPFVVPGIEGNRRMKYTVLAGLVVFFVGFAGLVGWEYCSRRVTHADEVSSGLGTRLLGTIPPLNPASGAGGAEPVMVEAIDTARTMLINGAPGGIAARALVVTSAVSGEGKTTLSGHLAISLARAGFRVLLVDADMHAPTAHDLFDVPSAPGLSELLRGDVEVDGATSLTHIPGLSVLPVGRWTLATHRALVGDRWRCVKHDLLSKYDYLVIDTAPLLLVSDTLLLAREADGVVISVLIGVSQTARVAETVGRLQRVGAGLVGVVVNNVRSAVRKHGYAYRTSKYVSTPVVAAAEKG